MNYKLELENSFSWNPSVVS